MADNPMPPLDGDTEAALKASIEKFGALVPIVLDHEGNIIDGHHRLKLALYAKSIYRVTVVYPETDRAAGLQAFDTLKSFSADYSSPDGEWGCDDDGSTVVGVPNMDPEEIARTLNLDRRHLDPEQRRQMVTELRQQGHSLRAIAGAVGASKSQVDRDLATVPRGTVPDKVKGLDGKTRPGIRAQPASRGAQPPAQVPDDDPPGSSPEDWNRDQWAKFDAQVVAATRTIVTAVNTWHQGLYEPSAEAVALLSLVKPSDLDRELAALLSADDG